MNRTTFKHVDPDDDKPAILPKENETAKKSLKFDHISKDEDSQSSFKSAASDNSRKRQQEEIFGSLSDDEELCSAGNLNAQLILFYCYNKCLVLDVNPSKKSKQEDVHSFTSIKEVPIRTPLFRPKRYVFRLVPEEPHQHITTHTGQRLYIRFRSEENMKKKVDGNKLQTYQ